MKGENVLKMGRRYVGYLSGVLVRDLNQTEFGCSAGVTIPRRANPFSIRHVHKGERELQQEVLVTPASSFKPHLDEGLRTNGSTNSGMSAPLMHH